MPNRRGFLASSLAASLAPWVTTRAPGEPAANERLQIGLIGLGQRGSENLRQLLAKPEAVVTALCDVDESRLRDAHAAVQKVGAAAECRGSRDFRELIARGDLDAVVIALPDHWHAIPAIACAEAGIDVHAEPPLALTVREGQAVHGAVERYGRIWQTGFWRRFDPYFQRACQAVARLGPVHTVEIGALGGMRDLTGDGKKGFFEEARQLDYDTWVGPAPWLPYHPGRVHGNWRWNLDYGGGHLLSTACHFVDVALWALGLDEAGPTKVEASGEFARTPLWNAPVRYDVSANFGPNLRLRVSCSLAPGVRWIGAEGWVYVDNGTLRASRDELIRAPGSSLANPFARHGKDPWQAFLDAVRHRKASAAPSHAAHRVSSVCQLGLLALEARRPVAWNAEKEEIIEDRAANELLGKAYREPWMLQG